MFFSVFLKIKAFSFRFDLPLRERVGTQCVSKSDPPLTIQWLKKGQDLTLSETNSASGLLQIITSKSGDEY